MQLWAVRLYDRVERVETVEVRDEYGLCRCRVEVVGDEFAHGVDAALTIDELPVGWVLRVEGEL